jgi:hypothetical protein
VVGALGLGVQEGAAVQWKSRRYNRRGRMGRL